MTDNDGTEAELTVLTNDVEAPYGIAVEGKYLGSGPVRLLVDGEIVPARLRVLQGEQHGSSVRPDEGTVYAVLDAPALTPGRHTVVATSTVADEEGPRAEATFELQDVPETGEDGRPTMRWLGRRLDFNVRRFPEGRTVPGARLRALEYRDQLRSRQADDPSPPVDPGCNWYPLGPSVVRDGQVFGAVPGTFTTAPISGRVTDIAIDPQDTQTIFVATAQGGLWRSRDGGRSWEPKTDFTISLACGSVTVDPSVTDAAGRSTRILVGTGEPNNSDSYYGAGMLLSTDGGETWVPRGTTSFVRAAFDTIAVDPADNQHLLAATDQGVYESADEGVNWTQVDPGVHYDLVVDWAAAGGAKAFAARQGTGIRSRTGAGPWSTLAGGLPGVAGRFALAMAPSNSRIMYAAIPSGSTVTFYRTSDGGTTWTAAAGTVAGAQLGYNLPLAVHPTDPNTLLFGEVNLWRSVDAGATWTRVSTGTPGIHADQHAIAFDPGNGNRVFAGNDGGAWLSTDGGMTWIHRNKDLATLQYFGSANHAHYEAVALGGTQDNGAQRYVGHPAWQHAALGDGAFCAIDRTANPHRWFETRWYSFPCFRSDSSGQAGTFVPKQTGIVTNSNWFYPPLEMDPNDSTVLYCGYASLFRTSDSAENWTAITGSLGANITAIAIAPSNSGIIYVGLTNGHVFLVTGGGNMWTATDVSHTPIPAGQISDIAIHPTDPNTVYVTTSNLIFAEAPGESFMTDHVYRTTNGGATWASVSTGLSPANPVNTVVIDPANPQTVFIGCDVGIFRTDNGGTSWAAWDQGLPNCSVQHLNLYLPQRLLRAATHGRSVWERPIDAATAPLVQLYVRDNILDTGRTPSPSGIGNPFDSTITEYWWHSADIKIDSPDPATNAYAFPGLDIDYLQFEGHVHDNPRRGTFVRAYAQVLMRGNNPATNVRVKTFWADASAALPPLPVDFWTAFPNADPMDTSHWHPLGPAKTIPSVAPGRPAVVGWSWQLSATQATHTCLLSVVTCDEDPIAVSTLNVGTAITSSNHVTLKNLHVDNVIPGAVGEDTTAGPYLINLWALRERAPIDIRFNPRGLPPGAMFHMLFPRFDATAGDEQLLRGLKRTKEIPRPLLEFKQPGDKRPVEFETGTAFTLEIGDAPLARRELPGLYGVLPRDRRFAALFMVTFPKSPPDHTVTFSVEQWVGKKLEGGSTYELRPAKRLRGQP